MTIDNQLAHNQQPRVTGALLALLATTALYACTPTGERPELTDQTVPAMVTTEAEPLSENYTKELNDYMQNDERTLRLNDWVRYFTGKLNVAAIENPSIVSFMSSSDSEGNSSLSYSIENLDKVFTFSLTGKEDIDNKLGLIPDSIAVDISSKKGGESDGAKGGFDAYLTFNSDSKSYDTGYADITTDSNGTNIVTNHSASIGSVSIVTTRQGDPVSEGGSSLSANEASRIDNESIAKFIRYMDEAFGVTSGLQDQSSPNTGEEQNSHVDSPEQGSTTYGTVPYPTVINGTIVVNTVPNTTINND